MNGILLLDTILVTMVITLLLVPLYTERKHRAAWQGRMKRAALRHIARGNSEYGQARYNAIGKQVN